MPWEVKVKNKLDLNKETVAALQLMSEQTGTKLFEKLVSIFGSETPVRIDAVKKAWLAKNYKELGEAAHGLKSGAAYLGADKLAFLAAQVEDNCSKSNFNFDFQSCISEMESSFLLAKKELDQDYPQTKIAS